jgi:tetratricopeptide (TPR) repeat protein
MRRAFASLIIVFFVAFPASAQPQEGKARTVELTLYLAKSPEPKQKYQLLPKAQEQTDADAVPLYEKAVQSLPKDFKTDQIRQWLDTPSDKLPREQVQSTLQQLKPTLQLLEQAAKCKQCNWPPFKPGTLPENLSEYRKLAYILALQARFQVAQGQYDQAISTLQIGLAMARHLGEAPTLIQGLVGVAIAGVIMNQAEELIQASNALSLYWALRDLPRPFINLTKQIELEIANIKKDRNPVIRKQFEEQLKPAHERARMIAKKLDRHIAALQCIEAMRLYAAGHNGKFPGALDEIAEVPVPGDPVTQKPFGYTRIGSKAVLEAAAPEGATGKDAMRYELKLMEQNSRP